MQAGLVGAVGREEHQRKPRLQKKKMRQRRRPTGG